MNLRALIVGIAAIAAVGTARAADFSSGPERVALLELYTSEGCSSCPPAERWLGGLRDDPRLWREFVPVAWHVNYWDYIGWRDRFASPAFTERQYAIARSWRSGRVYTPCFVRDGREWRSRDLTQARDTEAGQLSAHLDDGGRVRLAFLPVTTETVFEFDGFVALLGAGITSNVKAGENSGRKLTHEFVALSLQSTRLQRAAEGRWVAAVVIDVEAAADVPQRALAAWVTRRGELAPVQVTGGWLE